MWQVFDPTHIVRHAPFVAREVRKKPVIKTFPSPQAHSPFVETSTGDQKTCDLFRGDSFPLNTKHHVFSDDLWITPADFGVLSRNLSQKTLKRGL
jgi:hypothetical protein